MSENLPLAATSSTFESIKRTNPSGAEFWSARDLARVLEYSEYRHFLPVLTRAREACAQSGHRLGDHFETPVLSLLVLSEVRSIVPSNC